MATGSKDRASLIRALVGLAAFALMLGAVRWISVSHPMVLRPLFANLAEKDASRQATRMIAMLKPLPECERFKQAFREAGKGQPADGSTQYRMAHTWQDACTAGCCNQGGQS
jgi:hypothetical protein